jgi:CBS domain containing-hemolysin-like protein
MNAFFVIAEFSLVRVRKSQIEVLVEEGARGAKRAQAISENVNAYLSACQLGITLASLALGWLGEPAVSSLIYAPLASLGLPDAAVSAIAIAIGYIIVTSLHVIIGELVPKSLAILNTERYALFTATPLYFFYRITYPIMWLFNSTTNGIMHLTGHDTTNEHQAYTEEEIKILLEESAESGELATDQYEIMDNVFDLDDKDAKAIMTPRTELVALDIDDDLETLLDIMGKNKFTRYPVFKDSKDNIIGFVHIKDAYRLPADSTKENLVIRPINPVPESLALDKLLPMMQENHSKIVVVVDEHGGTAGIVTMSDVIEQIIGSVEDEYLHDDQDEILKTAENVYEVDGSLPVDQFVEFLGYEPVPIYDYETVGGLMLDLLDKIPTEGNSVELHHERKKITLTVKVMDGLRIDKIEVEFAAEPDQDPA